MSSGILSTPWSSDPSKDRMTCSSPIKICWRRSMKKRKLTSNFTFALKFQISNTINNAYTDLFCREKMKKAIKAWDSYSLVFDRVKQSQAIKQREALEARNDPSPPGTHSGALQIIFLIKLVCFKYHGFLNGWRSSEKL